MRCAMSRTSYGREKGIMSHLNVRYCSTHLMLVASRSLRKGIDFAKKHQFEYALKVLLPPRASTMPANAIADLCFSVTFSVMPML